MGQFIDIQTLINAKLIALSTIDSNKVFKAATAVTTGYPYVTLEALNETEEDEDEVNKYQVFRWRLRIYANMDKTGAGPVWAETTVLTVLDEIKDVFNADETLGGYADNMDWESIELGYSAFEAGEARTIEAVLRVYKLKKVT